MNGDSSLVWFRHDLRVADNPALTAAVNRGRPVICVFIWSPDEEGSWHPGAASRWWLHHSLERLNESLRRAGSRLVIRRGPSAETLASLCAETNASAVYWNRRYEPAVIERDTTIKSSLRATGRLIETFNGSLLREPWEVQTRAGRPYQVFTPFWRACRSLAPPEPPLPAPERIPAPDAWPASAPVGELKLLPTISWDVGIQAAWTPGEAAAAARLSEFAGSRLSAYHEDRNRPDRDGCSRLSPHLHFGEISPRQIWQAVGRRRSRGAETWLA